MINLEKKTREIESINFVAFSNNVVVVNTTPHPVTIQDMDGTLITVPTSVLINAKAEERKVSDLFVRTEFVGTEEGWEEVRNAYWIKKTISKRMYEKRSAEIAARRKSL